ncbi:MAG: diadenylate cyclase [Planctomycetota bacterium]
MNQLWSEFRSLNVFEVTILAGLIFCVLTVLRGTRGEAMFKTLAGLLAIGYIFVRGLATSDLFDGSKLTVVLDNVFAASVIGLVVIFQPELRRILALKIGARFFNPPVRDRAAVDEVIKAAFELKKKRTGALIVLERDNSLQEFTEPPATIVDGAVTASLLQSIFFVTKSGDGTPLHDGAVIVRDGRIAAASCFLPPTDPQNPNVPEHLGARHRAAIGLSEQQDAVIVVVSEESGSVSIVVGGGIEYDLDRETLARRLDELYLSQEPIRPSEPPPSASILDTTAAGLGEAEDVSDGATKSTTRISRRSA